MTGGQRGREHQHRQQCSKRALRPRFRQIAEWGAAMPCGGSSRRDENATALRRAWEVLCSQCSKCQVQLRTKCYRGGLYVLSCDPTHSQMVFYTCGFRCLRILGGAVSGKLCAPPSHSPLHRQCALSTKMHSASPRPGHVLAQEMPAGRRQVPVPKQCEWSGRNQCENTGEGGFLV